MLYNGYFASTFLIKYALNFQEIANQQTQLL